MNAVESYVILFPNISNLLFYATVSELMNFR